MAWHLKLVPDKTTVPFMRLRRTAFGLSGVLAALSIVLLVILGLNFGIDFRGGTLIQVKTQGPANISVMRDAVGSLQLGDLALQEFGEADEVLIRVERQVGDNAEQQVAVELIKRALEDAIEGASTRLVEEAWARFPATLAQAESADPAPTAAAADGDSPTEVEKNHPQPVGESVDKSDI
mgnify:CR=1 FL=1